MKLVQKSHLECPTPRWENLELASKSTGHQTLWSAATAQITVVIAQSVHVSSWLFRQLLAVVEERQKSRLVINISDYSAFYLPGMYLSWKNRFILFGWKYYCKCFTCRIYECNDRCKCNQQCKNRVVQKGLQCRLQMFKTQKKGWGIRCLDDIARGTFVCIYTGKASAKWHSMSFF